MWSETVSVITGNLQTLKSSLKVHTIFTFKIQKFPGEGDGPSPDFKKPHCVPSIQPL